MSFYFAYGSNMWFEQMRKRCPQHRIVEKVAILNGYRWIISSRGYANIIKSSQDEVIGTVYEISASDEQTLDKCEGVDNSSYNKEKLDIELTDKSLLACLVYIDPIEDEGKPKDEYIKRINNGIKDAELPPDYVQNYIRKFVHETTD